MPELIALILIWILKPFLSSMYSDLVYNKMRTVSPVNIPEQINEGIFEEEVINALNEDIEKEWMKDYYILKDGSFLLRKDITEKDKDVIIQIFSKLGFLKKPILDVSSTPIKENIQFDKHLSIVDDEINFVDSENCSDNKEVCKEDMSNSSLLSVWQKKDDNIIIHAYNHLDEYNEEAKEIILQEYSNRNLSNEQFIGLNDKNELELNKDGKRLLYLRTYGKNERNKFVIDVIESWLHDYGGSVIAITDATLSKLEFNGKVKSAKALNLKHILESNTLRMFLSGVIIFNVCALFNIEPALLSVAILGILILRLLSENILSAIVVGLVATSGQTAQLISNRSELYTFPASWIVLGIFLIPIIILSIIINRMNVSNTARSFFIRNKHDVQTEIQSYLNSIYNNDKSLFTTLYCYDDTWKLALDDLMTNTDGVIMDLRGFSDKNTGCQYEIDFIVKSNRLSSLLVIVDHSTAIEQVYRAFVSSVLKYQKDNESYDIVFYKIISDLPAIDDMKAITEVMLQLTNRTMIIDQGNQSSDTDLNIRMLHLAN